MDGWEGTEMVPVTVEWRSWCASNPDHEGFVTEGTGMLLCAECGAGCETDYDDRLGVN